MADIQRASVLLGDESIKKMGIHKSMTYIMMIYDDIWDANIGIIEAFLVENLCKTCVCHCYCEVVH